MTIKIKEKNKNVKICEPHYILTFKEDEIKELKKNVK